MPRPPVRLISHLACDENGKKVSPKVTIIARAQISKPAVRVVARPATIPTVNVTKMGTKSSPRRLTHTDYTQTAHLLVDKAASSVISTDLMCPHCGKSATSKLTIGCRLSVERATRVALMCDTTRGKHIASGFQYWFVRRATAWALLRQVSRN